MVYSTGSWTTAAGRRVYSTGTWTAAAVCKSTGTWTTAAVCTVHVPEPEGEGGCRLDEEEKDVQGLCVQDTEHWSLN